MAVRAVRLGTVLYAMAPFGVSIIKARLAEILATDDNTTDRLDLVAISATLDLDWWRWQQNRRRLDKRRVDDRRVSDVATSAILCDRHDLEVRRTHA